MLYLILCSVAGFILGTFLGVRLKSETSRANGFDEGFKWGKETALRMYTKNVAYGKFASPQPFSLNMPQGARDSMCVECGHTFGTHSAICSHYTSPAPAGSTPNG